MRGLAALSLSALLACPASAQEPGGRPELALPPVNELMQKLVTDRDREFEFTLYHLYRHGAAAVPALREVLNGGSVKRRPRPARRTAPRGVSPVWPARLPAGAGRRQEPGGGGDQTARQAQG